MRHFAVQEHVIDEAFVGVVGISFYNIGGSLTLCLQHEPEETFITTRLTPL